MTLQEIESKIKYTSENYKDGETGGYITGDGPVPCNILFVGEAPGKNEVASGKPFVGTAGKTLDKYLNLVGLSRDKIRITNTCFFRPIKINIGKTNRKTISNRTPKVSEVNLFREILDEEIKLVAPKLIITLGNTPLKRLTDYENIGSCHGKLTFNEDLNKYVFPMYHPSALTYNRNDTFKEIYDKDWKELKNVLKKFI